MMDMKRHSPFLSDVSYVSPSATLVGNVEIWDYASVWNDVVVRGGRASCSCFCSIMFGLERFLNQSACLFLHFCFFFCLSFVAFVLASSFLRLF